MFTRRPFLPVVPAALCMLGVAASTLSAEILPSSDSFGTPGNQFSIDFVLVGNVGNGADVSGYGTVPYGYRIGVTEVPQDWITKAKNSGMTNVTAGPWTGSQPATNMTWYEAAAFVNWLNTTTGHQAAYDLVWAGTAWTINLWSSTDAWQAGGENLYRHKDAYYFLPSESEWFKAAFHKNGGVTANYWYYATGSDTAPTAVVGGTSSGTAVYNAPTVTPAAVNAAGGSSPYGTTGQNGNVFEWQESAFTAPNNSSGEPRVFRGGDWYSGADFLNSSARFAGEPSAESFDSVGFRVASAATSDTDGDGIADQFETATGIYVSPADTGTSPTIPDSDGDGFKDGFEIAAGFNPTSSASTPETFSSIVKTGSSSVEFHFNAANGINYRIEAAPELAGWSTIETNITGAGGTITRSYSTVGNPKRFFRPRRN